MIDRKTKNNKVFGRQVLRWFFSQNIASKYLNIIIIIISIIIYYYYITTAVQYDRRVFFNIYLYVTAFLQPSYFLYLHYLALKNYES